MQRRNSSMTKEDKIYLWWVPLTYTTDFQKAAKTAWLADNQTTKTLSIDASENQWIIFNVNHDGQYFFFI